MDLQETINKINAHLEKGGEVVHLNGYNVLYVYPEPNLSQDHICAIVDTQQGLKCFELDHTDGMLRFCPPWPTQGSVFYYVGSLIEVEYEHFRPDFEGHKLLKNRRNFFKTREEAEEKARQIRDLLLKN